MLFKPLSVGRAYGPAALPPDCPRSGQISSSRREHIKFPARETYRQKDRARTVTLLPFLCDGRYGQAALPPCPLKPGSFFAKRKMTSGRGATGTFLHARTDCLFFSKPVPRTGLSISSRQRRACTGVGLNPVFCGEQKQGRKRGKRRRSRSEGKTAQSRLYRSQTKLNSI